MWRKTRRRRQLLLIGANDLTLSFLLLNWIYVILQTVCAEPQLSQFRCTGEDLILFCNAGTKIKIYNAIYGRSPARLCLSLPDDPCIRPELKEIGALCNEKTECKITVTTKSLPQCWPLESDNLQVEFECITAAAEDAASASTPKTTPTFIPPLVKEATPRSLFTSETGEREIEAEILGEAETGDAANGGAMAGGVTAERDGGMGATSAEMGPIIGGSVAAVIIMILALILVALVVCRGHTKRFNKLKFSRRSSDTEYGNRDKKSHVKNDGSTVAAISHPRPLKHPPIPIQKHGPKNNPREVRCPVPPLDKRPRYHEDGKGREGGVAAARPKTSSSETSSNGGKSKLEYGSWRVYQKPRDARAVKSSDVYY